MGDGILQTAAIVSSSSIVSARAERQRRVAAVTHNVEDGIVGYGYLHLDNELKGVCAVTPNGLARPPNDTSPPTRTLWLTNWVRSPEYFERSVDDTFISAKRHQCGAVYASSTDLADLANAFSRDGVKYSYWPFWYDEAVLAASAADAASAQKQQVEASADEGREALDEEAIAAAKAADAEVVRQKQQQALRQKYGAAAKAFELSLAAELTEFVTAPMGGTRFADKYPALASAYRLYLGDGWELVDHATELDDYGMSEFKNRQLELGIARSSIKLRNRILGEYKDLCYLTAFVNDAEFSMEREPFGIECADSAQSLQTYRVGERFQSLWVAQ